MPQPMRQDVGKAHHNRGRQIALLQALYHLEQIDLVRIGGVRPHYHMAEPH